MGLNVRLVFGVGFATGRVLVFVLDAVDVVLPGGVHLPILRSQLMRISDRWGAGEICSSNLFRL